MGIFVYYVQEERFFLVVLAVEVCSIGREMRGRAGRGRGVSGAQLTPFSLLGQPLSH